VAASHQINADGEQDGPKTSEPHRGSHNRHRTAASAPSHDEQAGADHDTSEAL
jgi:hypothetical protein